MADEKQISAVLIGVALIIGIISFLYTNQNESIIIKTNESSSPQNTSTQLTNATTNSTNKTISEVYTIEITTSGFSPKELTIKKGDIVKWINKDNLSHTITSDTGNELGSSSLISNEAYSHKFNFDGTYNYHCTLHQIVKGKIIVEI